MINIYKEAGFTSMDVVAVLRGILKQKKIGHTGTLDPSAQGVLLVCLGNATKLCDMLENRSKVYKCRMLLGKTTDTEDTTGNVTGEFPVTVSEDDVKNAVMSFVGDYDQIPPMYSAIKVGGKKLYEIARAGKEIERKPRHIVIHDISDIEISLPYVSFTVSCSKGTYIRSLCRDIGEKLSCGGCMDNLLRIKVGDTEIENSLKIDDVKELVSKGEIDKYIIPTQEAFRGSKVLNVRDESEKLIDNGNPLSASDFKEDVNPTDGERFVVYNNRGVFTATYIFREDKNKFMPEKMFL